MYPSSIQNKKLENFQSFNRVAKVNFESKEHSNQICTNKLRPRKLKLLFRRKFVKGLLIQRYSYRSEIQSNFIFDILSSLINKRAHARLTFKIYQRKTTTSSIILFHKIVYTLFQISHSDRYVIGKQIKYLTQNFCSIYCFQMLISGNSLILYQVKVN